MQVLFVFLGNKSCECPLEIVSYAEVNSFHITYFFFFPSLLSNPHEMKPLPLQHSDKTAIWRAASQILGPRRREGLPLQRTEEQVLPESPQTGSARGWQLVPRCSGWGAAPTRKWHGGKCGRQEMGRTYTVLWLQCVKVSHKTLFRGKDIYYALTPLCEGVPHRTVYGGRRQLRRGGFPSRGWQVLWHCSQIRTALFPDIVAWGGGGPEPFKVRGVTEVGNTSGTQNLPGPSGLPLATALPVCPGQQPPPLSIPSSLPCSQTAVKLLSLL
jgi:hypothetical protein